MYETLVSNLWTEHTAPQATETTRAVTWQKILYVFRVGGEWIRGFPPGINEQFTTERPEWTARAQAAAHTAIENFARAQAKTTPRDAGRALYRDVLCRATEENVAAFASWVRGVRVFGHLDEDLDIAFGLLPTAQLRIWHHCLCTGLPDMLGYGSNKELLTRDQYIDELMLTLCQQHPARVDFQRLVAAVTKAVREFATLCMCEHGHLVAPPMWRMPVAGRISEEMQTDEETMFNVVTRIDEDTGRNIMGPWMHTYLPERYSQAMRGQPIQLAPDFGECSSSVRAVVLDFDKVSRIELNVEPPECTTCTVAQCDFIWGTCKHMICRGCVDRILRIYGSQSRCPMCRDPFKIADARVIARVVVESGGTHSST